MAKAKLKTTETKASVTAFVNAVPDERKRKDAKKLLKMFKDITGEKPKMWGPSIIGYGKYTYKYESGREGVICKTGFSPRSTALTLYILDDYPRLEELLGKLGKFKTGKSCLYIKKLEDVDEQVLHDMIKSSWDYMTNKYG